MEWNDGLSGQSLRVAGSTANRLRVMAGPGTGKTYAMIRRIARLLQSGVSAQKILAVTFTRAAAADIASELRKLGISGADEVDATTLHAFGFSVLGKSKALERTGRVARPVLNFEQKFILADLHDRTQHSVTKCQEYIESFSAAWARMQSEDPGWPTDPEERKFAQDLKQWLVFHRAMLLGEIITEAWKYIRGNPAAEGLPNFDYVLVDEYQDLNRAEQELIEVVTTGAKTTIIGDPDQSIYSFKFAHPEGIADYSKVHQDTVTENLEECRRCPSVVVSMAACLIANNTDSAESARQLSAAASNSGGEVHIVQWPSFEEEARGIAKLVEHRIVNGTPPGRVLVLANRAVVGAGIADALGMRGIPVRNLFTQSALDGNPRDKNDCEVLEAFTLLALLADPDDRVSLRCWCGLGSTSLNARGWREIWQYAERDRSSPREVLTKLSNGSVSLPFTAKVLERYTLLLSQQQRCQALVGDKLLDAVFPAGHQWSLPFRDHARELDGIEFDAAKLLKCIRESAIQPAVAADPDYVRVMSLHKSKGLSADLVLVLGCVEGIIPAVSTNQGAAERERQLREQRRLFYVAITRPKSTLVISSAVETNFASAKRMNIPVFGHGGSVTVHASQFLSELGPSAPRPVRGQALLDSLFRTPRQIDMKSGTASVPSTKVDTSASATDISRSVRFGIVTALPEEFAAVVAMLDDSREWSIEKNVDPNEYSIGEIPSPDSKRHVVVVTMLKKMGTNSAAAAVTNLIRSFPMVSNVLMVGIAGGVPCPENGSSHVRLGDVVVSNEYGLVQFDQGKMASGVFEVRDTSAKPSSLLAGKIRRLEANRLRGMRPWEQLISRGRELENGSRPSSATDVLKRGSGVDAVVVDHPIDPHRISEMPKIHYGRIGSSNTLVKDEQFRDRLRAAHSIKAVEMEGSGIADGTWDMGRHYLLVRGICDYCDSHKNDVWHGYAAVAAAAYARALIASIPISDLDP